MIKHFELDDKNNLEIIIEELVGTKENVMPTNSDYISSCNKIINEIEKFLNRFETKISKINVIAYVNNKTDLSMEFYNDVDNILKNPYLNEKPIIVFIKSRKN